MTLDASLRFPAAGSEEEPEPEPEPGPGVKPLSEASLLMVDDSRFDCRFPKEVFLKDNGALSCIHVHPGA